MIASSHSFPKARRGPNVLGELLHSLSQPLTTLRCSLELSLDRSLNLSIKEAAEQPQHESLAVALQQTEKVIGMIELMREYLDAEQPAPAAFPAALEPVIRSVIEELSSIAAVGGVQLVLVGRCTAAVPVPEARLRLALQYLIVPMIEAQQVGAKVMLLLGESSAGTVLRVKVQQAFPPTKRDPVRTTLASASTLRRVRWAIAGRVLESMGASLVFGGRGVELAGFILRIPRRAGFTA